MKKVLLYLFLGFSYFANAQGAAQRIALLNLQKANSVESSRAGQIGLTDSQGNQRYAQYTEVDLVPISYVPTPTGNTQNYSEFVKTSNGDVYYIDWQGRSVLIKDGASVAISDRDWLEIGNKQVPDNIRDSIYTDNYVAINMATVWPQAQLLVGDSTSLAGGNIVVAGLRDSRIGFYRLIDNSWSSIGQEGGSLGARLGPGTTAFNVTAAGGTGPTQTSAPFRTILSVNKDSTIQFVDYSRIRNDTAAIVNFFYSDMQGYLRSSPVEELIYKDTVLIVSDGQSNSIGQGIPSLGETFNFEKNIKIWNNTAWVSPRLGFAPFNLTGANNAAINLVDKLAEENPNTLYLLVQSGNSGQPIAYWVDGTKPGYVATNNMLLAALTALGNTSIKADALIWTQGESDYLRTPAQYQFDFYTLRQQWLTAGWYTASTRHILTGLYIGPGNIYGFQDATLRTIGLDSIVQTGYANTYGLSVYDQIHWDSPSLTKLGRDVLYNAYQATPHPYTTGPGGSGISGSVSANQIPKGGGIGLVDSRLSDTPGLLQVHDAATVNTTVFSSDITPTGAGQEAVKLRLSARWAPSVPSHGSDQFADAEIALQKATVINNGGTDLAVKTSGFGAAGLQNQGWFTHEGYIKARTGFQVGSPVLGQILYNNGTAFVPTFPTQSILNTWGAISRESNLVTDDGILLRSNTTPNAAYASARFRFVNNDVALLRLTGGSAANQGPRFAFYKDTVNPQLLFSLATESATTGGTSNAAHLYLYNSDRFKVQNSLGVLFSCHSVGVGVLNDAPTEALDVTGNIKASSWAGGGTRILTANAAGVGLPDVIQPTMFASISGSGTEGFTPYWTGSGWIFSDRRQSAHFIETGTGTVSASSNRRNTVINPGSTQATLTVNLHPAGSPSEGQEVLLTFAAAVTSLTIASNGTAAVLGAPTTTQAGRSYLFKYYSSVGPNGTWILQQ